MSNKLIKMIFKYMHISLLIFLYLFSKGKCSQLNNISPQSDEETQTYTVKEAFKRILAENEKLFQIEIKFNMRQDNKDVFHIEKYNDTTIFIKGSSGVAIMTGLNYYLKYKCKCSISWQTKHLSLPNNLPFINETVVFNDRFVYYQNVCTASYSFVWWNWDKWETHIDWMALNGINLPLASTGQEEIWKRVYKKLNLTINEINEHFAGPAFLSWSRMGNIRGWGGPLYDNWHLFTLALQHNILKRMRNFGMIPILPGFAGQVPKGLKRLYPNSSMTALQKWNNFDEKYCCPYLLEPTDPLFQYIGTLYMNEMISEFGTDHLYNSDTFNEMVPSNDNTEYLKKVGKSVYSVMVSVDPKAVWVMQNWLFVHDALFWTVERAEALLTSVPIGSMLVLDLQSEQFPQYRKLQSYFGQPFIWCMLHNFGGTLGLFGSVEIINKEPYIARNIINNTMIGIGISPEGINQNYVVYDLMLEASWRKSSANLTEWFTKYSTRNYGQINKHAIIAWQLLKSSVYSYQDLIKMRGKYIFNRRPRLNLKPWIWYNKCDLIEAWDEMILASSALYNSSGFQHDLVDVTRQVLQVLGDQIYPQIIFSFRRRKKVVFRRNATIFLDIFNDMENILLSNEAFLLGKWLTDAKSLGKTNEEKMSYEYNARNQITLWGPKGEIYDYANKQWAGIVSKYFEPRWSLFLSAMNQSLNTRIKFNEKEVLKRIFLELEQPFTMDTSVFPTSPIGDTIEIAKTINKKLHALNIFQCRNIKKRENILEVSEKFDANIYPRIIQT